MNCCYIYTNNSPIKEYNGFYENLLYKSISTLLMFYKNDIENLYILIDNNIDNKSVNSIKSNINGINNNAVNIIFKLVDLNITNSIKYPINNVNSGKINKIGLLKFFIPYLVDCDDILYIDCDILFNENVLHDLYLNFNNDNILYKIYQYGWNSGLILFNCINWRKNKTLLNDIIDYYENNKDIKFVDNDTFAWLANFSKYADLIIKDENYKINFPINKDDFNKYYPDLLSTITINENDDFWKIMNVIHIVGVHEEKQRYVDKIYDYIKKKN